MNGRESRCCFLAQTLVTILFFFAVGVNALIIVQGAVAPVHVVAGSSMAPGIAPRDGLILSSPEPGELRVGDVVVFNDPEASSQLVVHRIVALEEKGGSIYLRTKGDNNPEADPFLILPGDVRGKVAARIPGFGVFYDFVRTPYGFLMTVVAPVLLFPLFLLSRSIERRLRGPRRDSSLMTAEPARAG